MADEKLSDDEVDAVLQERLRIISTLKAETEAGTEALRIAFAGDFAAATKFERDRSKDPGGT